jgi:hypothetical protein
VRNVLVAAIVLGIIGLIVGYFLFASLGNGRYMPLVWLFGATHGGFFARLGSDLRSAALDLPVVRRNILLSGLVGAIVGFVVALSARRRR